MHSQPEGLGGGTRAADPSRIRRAVLAAAGESRHHPAEGGSPTHAVAMMVDAVQDAARDAGSHDLLDAVGLVAATVGSDDAPDPAGALREALGIEGARSMVAPIGVTQQRLVSNAILAVERGEVDAALVVGGEAKASEIAARRHGATPAAVPQGPGADLLLEPGGELMAEAEVAAMLWDPVAQYALIDSALARAEGRSPTELRTDVSELWARFDDVASRNPSAEFAGGRSAAQLAEASRDNRMLAFPYNKWHSTQWALDHGAALLICAEDVARGHGVAEEDLLHPLVAVDSSWGLSLSRRAEVHRWPAMGELGAAAEAHLGLPVAGIGAIELYSCFPAAVRVQQRELGLPRDGAPTILGGMPFAGGPFNHFTYMATAGVARALRRGEADRGLVTTVSGLLTKAGLMVWGREPLGGGALVADLGPEVREATGSVEVAPFDADRRIGDHETVVAATVTGGWDPRLFALVEDAAGIRHVVSEPAPDGDAARALEQLAAPPPAN